MTLQEAIQHLQETLADNNHEWGCEECRKEHEQLLEWLKELESYKSYGYKTGRITSIVKYQKGESNA